MRLLDLFCGAGGAAMGYHRAGFTEIVGIDIEPQPDYPFTFIQADALESYWYELGPFDLIHASPPCQPYTAMTNRHGSSQPALIDDVRDWWTTGYVEYPGYQGNPLVSVPLVIENVLGAPLRPDLRLTGAMFNLDVHRPRVFELGGWFCLSPPKARAAVGNVAVYGKPDGRRLWDRVDGSTLTAWSSLEEGQEALGVPWITDWHQVREAIPPAYTEYIGEQFLATYAG